MPIFDSKDDGLNPKAISKKSLTRQNLIFLISGIIIIAILIAVAISQITFLLDKINEGTKIPPILNGNIKSFDIDGFNKIKDKLLAPSFLPILEISTTSTSTEQ